jgi:hypothetical protein
MSGKNDTDFLTDVIRPIPGKSACEMNEKKKLGQPHQNLTSSFLSHICVNFDEHVEQNPKRTLSHCSPIKQSISLIASEGQFSEEHLKN